MDLSLDSIKAGISSFTEGMGSKIAGVLDPSNARLSIAGLLKGGRRQPEQPYETRIDFVGLNGSSVNVENDWRMRISVGQSSGIFYQGNGDPGVLGPLSSTLGVVFPYTPTVSVNYSAGYSSQKSTHSNYPAYFYEASEVQEIQISAPFSVQNVEEGQYLLASIYFFRACTKMFYGQDAERGAPPPLVYLQGLGQYQFNLAPCVVNQFTYNLPAYNKVSFFKSRTRNPRRETELKNPMETASISTGTFNSVLRYSAAFFASQV